MSYAFGDSERAARRLAQVARVFEPASSAFVMESAHAGSGVALDLGCGPGYTTEMLSRALPGARCIGVDASEAYIASARGRTRGCEFVHHDVLATPYPTPRADVIYVRFLLSHLSDVESSIAAFASQLAPGGRLLLDEVEWIRSDAAPFARYLDLVEAVLASEGQCLYVGRRIGELAERGGRQLANAVRTFEVDPRDAAAMFALNWETLREHEAVASRTTPAERDTLADSLAALRDGAGASAPVTWGLRQVALGA